MDDLKISWCWFYYYWSIFTTISKTLSIKDIITPDEFKDLENIAKQKDFLLVSSSPLTRSSYHADEDFAKLKQNRIKKN